MHDLLIAFAIRAVQYTAMASVICDKNMYFFVTIIFEFFIQSNSTFRRYERVLLGADKQERYLCIDRAHRVYWLGAFDTVLPNNYCYPGLGWATGAPPAGLVRGGQFLF